MCECGSLDFKVVVLNSVNFIESLMRGRLDLLDEPGYIPGDLESNIYDVAVAYVKSLEDFHFVCLYLHDKIISAILDSFWKKYKLFEHWT